MSQTFGATAEQLLEALLSQQTASIDRPAVKQALHEAMAAWPGSSGERWWKWLVEAGNSLQMRLLVLDLQPREIVQLVRDGGVVATRHPDGSLIRLKQLNRKNFTWATVVNGVEEVESVSRRSARSRLREIAPEQTLRVIVNEPTMTVGNTRGLSPFNRLMALIRPEQSDIWIVTLFALLVGVLMLATPIAVESLVNTLAFGRYLQPVLVLAVLLFGFLAFGAALKALQTWVVEIIQRRLFVRIAGELSQRLPRITANNYDEQDPPELVNRFLDVVTIQKSVAALLLDAVSIVLGTFLGMVVLAFYHPWLLGFDLVLMGLMIFTLGILGRGAVSSSIKESKYKYRLTAWLEEIARCPLTFRQDGGQEFARERADLLVVDYLTARKSHFSILMRQVMFSLFLQAVASTALLGLGGWLVIQGQLTLGQLVAAELIVAIVVGAFAKMGKHLEIYYDLLAAVDKIGVMLDLPVEKASGVLHLENQGPAELTCRSLTAVAGNGEVALRNFHLQVESRQKLAIWGGSEAARTTLADLCYGLRSPESGFLELDGTTPGDLRPDILRQHVALVRNLEVLTGTILENIHLNRPGITTADVRRALRSVGLLEEINRLEQGLETVLTRSGNPLTRSQIQRLMIARAIVSSPRLLVIDGLLDSLPDDQQEQILGELTRAETPWTLLVMTGQERIRNRCPDSLCLSPADALTLPESSLVSVND